MKVLLLRSLLLCMIGVSSAPALGATISTDTADNYSRGNLATGSNAGTNWGAWNITVGTSTTLSVVAANETGHTGLIGSNNAFAISSGGASIYQVARPFGSGGLVAGQTFSMDVDPGQGFGFEFDLAKHGTGLSYQTYKAMSAGFDYLVNGTNDSGIVTTTPVHATFTMNSNGTVTTSLTPLPSGTTYTNTSPSSIGFTPDNLLYQNSGNTGTANDFTLQNPNVTSNPEPDTLGLVAIASSGLLFRWRRVHG